MTAEKQDYLRLCNEPEVPFEDFTAQFCSRCLQPECGRSQHGKSSFERRVATWEDRLFKNVPKLDPRDPRYTKLTAKKFLEINPGSALEIGRSAWVDPRDLDEPAPKPQKVEAPPEQPVQIVEAAEEKAPELPPAPPAKFEAPAPMNTPNQSGKMIGPAKPPVTVDPWEPKQKSLEGRVVKPGAKIRMGGTPPTGV